jgi:hypothetical protein
MKSPQAGRRAIASVAASFALCLAAAVAHAQQPARTGDAAPPATNAVSPESIKALQDMGAYLQTVTCFRATAEVTGERVPADGQKLQHTATATLDVARPNRLRVRMSSPRPERELVFDGRTVTLHTPALKYYSTVELVDTVGGLVGKRQERFGVDVPLSDLFPWGTPAAPLDTIQSGMNAGQDFVGQDLCDHYAFRQGDVDWQIWIMTGSRPLPRKIVSIDRKDEARPLSVTLIGWNTKPTFDAATFTFVPPKGATKVELVQLKSK